MYRNKSLLENSRSVPGTKCGAIDGTVVTAHSNQLRDGKGRGIKAHDYRIAAMCYTCHAEIDQGATLSKAERVECWEEAHRKTIALLFESGFLYTKF